MICPKFCPYFCHLRENRSTVIKEPIYKRIFNIFSRCKYKCFWHFTFLWPSKIPCETSLLKPSGYCQCLYSKILRSAYSVFIFFVWISGREFWPMQHSVIGFYNRVGRCLLRGTNWVFKQNGLHFALKELKMKLMQHRNILLVETSSV